MPIRVGNRAGTILPTRIGMSTRSCPPYGQTYKELRAPHQRPEGLERRGLAERLQRREDLARRLLVDRVRGAVHELLLDLRRRERELRRAARVVAQLLDLAAVAERHDDARGAVLGNV